MSFTLDAKAWAVKQFSDCSLKDKRRTKRLVKMAEQIANNPSGSLPDQTETWGDLKAAYRLFDCEQVTFEAVAEPHWKQTRQQPSGRYLLLDDTTELDFGIHREIDDLGPTGNGKGRGFLLHNALMARADDKAVVGVAGQAIQYRKPVPKKEKRSRRMQRQRESEVWGRVVDQVGPPPEGREFIHVCDRGADNFVRRGAEAGADRDERGVGARGGRPERRQAGRVGVVHVARRGNLR